jgi:hypothetical protein
MDVDALGLEPEASADPKRGVVDRELADLRDRPDQRVDEVEQLVEALGGTQPIDVSEQPVAALLERGPRNPPLVRVPLAARELGASAAWLIDSSSERSTRKYLNSRSAGARWCSM